MALVSSGFTIIHNKLNCDQHQAECRRLQSLYQGLSEDYANLAAEAKVEEFRSKLQVLNTERTQVVKGAGATPSVGSIEKATKLIGS